MNVISSKHVVSVGYYGSGSQQATNCYIFVVVFYIMWFETRVFHKNDIHRPLVLEVISQDVPPYPKCSSLVYYTTFMISTNGTAVVRLQREVTKSNVVLPIEFIFQIQEVLFSQTPSEIKQQSLLHIEWRGRRRKGKCIVFGPKLKHFIMLNWSWYS